MLDWRDFASDLKFHLRRAKEDKAETLKTVNVEALVQEIESQYIQQDKIDILRELNKPVHEDHYLDKIVDHNIKAISEAYDKGSAYTSLVIGAGYATFFGLWSAAKDITDDITSSYSFFFLIISAVSFVFFEVYKNLLTSYNLLKRSKASVKAKECKTFKEQYEIIAASEKDKELANILFIPVWVITAATAVIFALIGVGLLIICLVEHIAEYHHLL